MSDRQAADCGGRASPGWVVGGLQLACEAALNHEGVQLWAVLNGAVGCDFDDNQSCIQVVPRHLHACTSVGCVRAGSFRKPSFSLKRCYLCLLRYKECYKFKNMEGIEE